ncbi:hypothetical protein BJ508DRAFT_373972 [Ascobolus immersus RN42]|uniref:DUF6536 domain-containing protein n=1 Tax=Ascobolus immersus RN42 TaxID=1160509 RepID=A0A3N4IHS5_ASCIM|nr:hypothetical protein BJ508DRAFT_373972 [Ascobolus immersus RN42]
MAAASSSYQRVSLDDNEQDDRDVYELRTLNQIPAITVNRPKTPPAYNKYTALATTTEDVQDAGSAAGKGKGKAKQPQLRIHTLIGRPRGTPLQTHVLNAFDGAKTNVLAIIDWTAKHSLFRHRGWQFGIRLGLCFSGLVFVANILLLIVGLTYPSGDEGGSIRVLASGQCGNVKERRLWAHLMMNIVATVLLGISNYTLQLLCAPTRKEVQKQHDKRRWLDIGISSIRNLKVVGWRKVTCWIVLAATSAILHLMYNSIIFSTFTTYESQALKITDQTLRRGFERKSHIVQSWDCSYTYHKLGIRSAAAAESYLRSKDDEFYTFMRNRTERDYQRLESKECLEEYLSDLTTSRDGIILVLDDEINGAAFDPNSTCTLRVFDETKTIQSTATSTAEEICLSAELLGSPERSDEPCTTAEAGTFGQVWRVGLENERGGLLPVKYCLIHRRPRTCQLNLLIPMLIGTIIINFIQLAIVAFTLFFLTGQDKSLCTLGDAISSFLAEEDVSTVGECTMSAEDAVLRWEKKRKGPMRHVRAFSFSKGFRAVDNRGSTWTEVQLRWYQAASRTRWFISYFLLFTSLTLASWGLSISLHRFYESTAHLSLQSIWSRGFGYFDKGLTTGVSYILNKYLPELQVLTANILAANTPQLILAALYFTFNQLFTTMLTAHEFSLFSLSRSPLRVSSSPIGIQRITPWLQLPPAWSIAVTVTAFGLHFFASQSIFLVRYSYLSLEGQERILAGSVLGYSPISMVFGIVLAVLAALASVAVGWRVFPLGGPPLAGTCSAAVSAACHLRKEEKGRGVEGRAVKWGVVEM